MLLVFEVCDLKILCVKMELLSGEMFVLCKQSIKIVPNVGAVKSGGRRKEH